MQTTTKGIEKILARLNGEFVGIQNRSDKGLIMVAAYLRKDMEVVIPTTPVDYGNLKASWFVTSSGKLSAGGGDVGKMFKGPQAARVATEHPGVVARAKAELPSGKHMNAISMGYTAFYAWWVHEAVDKTFHKPGSGPQWFEAALKRNQKKIVEIVRANAKIQ